jgi:zinc transporter ZupT
MFKGDGLKMNISRRLGTLVVFGVPAVIGGGIVYALFGSYVSVFAYEIILLFVAGGFASK